MDRDQGTRTLVARCVVCKGNIFDAEPFEVWEGGYYCERHSLPYLRERAREYAALLAQKEGSPRP
jgi:hypothetical protein